jgi:hypothetical protein
VLSVLSSVVPVKGGVFLFEASNLLQLRRRDEAFVARLPLQAHRCTMLDEAKVMVGAVVSLKRLEVERGPEREARLIQCGEESLNRQV